MPEVVLVIFQNYLKGGLVVCMRFEAGDVKNLKCFCVFLWRPGQVTLKWPDEYFDLCRRCNILWLNEDEWGYLWSLIMKLISCPFYAQPVFLIFRWISPRGIWCSWGTVIIFSHQSVMSSWAMIIFLYSKPWEQLHNQVLGQTTLKTTVHAQQWVFFNMDHTVSSF